MNATGIRLLPWSIRIRPWMCVYALSCLWCSFATSQQASTQPTDWQQVTREQVREGKLDAALETVEERLNRHPDDLEARGWHGRVLAWQGRWSAAEREYRLVLRIAPDDIEILTGLADVLLWQQRPQSALEIIDQVRARSPADQGILLRRARILRDLGLRRELREQLREILQRDPGNKQAQSLLASFVGDCRHELRVGSETDTFSYTDAAQIQSVVLSSRWKPRWSTLLSSEIYERFGQQAQKFAAGATIRISNRDWLGLGGAGANHRGIIPKAEMSFEYGHGFRFPNRFLRGVEASYQQHWLWYRGAHVLTLTAAQTYYLPRDFSWLLAVTGARSGFANAGSEWLPSGRARLAFPVHERLSANLTFAVGSENYSQIDQISRFSAHTYAGGLRFRFAAAQDIQGYVARQNRSHDRSQTSYGLSYGIRF